MGAKFSPQAGVGVPPVVVGVAVNPVDVGANVDKEGEGAAVPPDAAFWGMGNAYGCEERGW